MGEGADAVRFPAFIALGDARLAVRYRFEPGAPDDGMTVSVPLHLLNALDPARLSWLAPGFVADKAAALIRGLPKALRRNFVPAPDFARAFAQAWEQASADTLTSELAPSEQRKMAFALNRLASNLGLSIGPAVGGLDLGGRMSHRRTPGSPWQRHPGHRTHP